MIKKSLSAFTIGLAILATSSYAGADKACLKTTKVDYAMAKEACKAAPTPAQ